MNIMNEPRIKAGKSNKEVMKQHPQIIQIKIN
jgi:hypothetical protein